MKIVESVWEWVNRDKMDANLVGGNNHILDNVHLGGTDEHWTNLSIPFCTNSLEVIMSTHTLYWCLTAKNLSRQDGSVSS